VALLLLAPENGGIMAHHFMEMMKTFGLSPKILHVQGG
jgi:hypothetical protein